MKHHFKSSIQSMFSIKTNQKLGRQCNKPVFQSLINSSLLELMTADSLIAFRNVFTPPLKWNHYLVKAGSFIKVNLIEICFAPCTDTCCLCIDKSPMARSSAAGLTHSLVLIKKTIKWGEAEGLKLCHSLSSKIIWFISFKKMSDPTLSVLH